MVKFQEDPSSWTFNFSLWPLPNSAVFSLAPLLGTLQISFLKEFFQSSDFFFPLLAFITVFLCVKCPFAFYSCLANYFQVQLGIQMKESYIPHQFFHFQQSLKQIVCGTMCLRNYLQIRQMVALKYHLLALRRDCTNIPETVCSLQAIQCKLALVFKCYAQKRSLQFYKQMDSFCLIQQCFYN